MQCAMSDEANVFVRFDRWPKGYCCIEIEYALTVWSVECIWHRWSESLCKIKHIQHSPLAIFERDSNIFVRTPNHLRYFMSHRLKSMIIVRLHSKTMVILAIEVRKSN